MTVLEDSGHPVRGTQACEIGYREFPPSRELYPFAVCTWERRVSEDGGATERRILPDGCIDLVWREGRLLVAGPDTGAWTSGVPSGGTVVGLRMRPGIGGSVLGLRASELRDARAEAVDVWGRAGSELTERVGEQPDPEGRRALLASALTNRLADAERTDSLVLAASRRLGFLRFQRFVARAPSVISGDEDLARIAADLGYADQAHLSRDSLRLSGLTPRKMVESWTS